jgi:ribosomal protein S18 acetylase RimI-like enzyme
MSGFVVEDFRLEDAGSLVRMWRESFEYGVGVQDPHSIEDRTAYLHEKVRAKNRVRVAREAGVVLGFLASNPESIAQLYVRVGRHRRGVGRMLLDLAKHESEGSLWLFTFAKNVRACAFYESQGFKVTNRGFEPTWQLEDIKYQWHSP